MWSEGLTSKSYCPVPVVGSWPMLNMVVCDPFKEQAVITVKTVNFSRLRVR